MTALTTIAPDSGALSIASAGSFEHIQRVAKCLAESQLVPTTFQRNLPNVVVALELSSRVGASPIMVMQNLNVIHGRPSWSSQFIIAAVNATGRYKPLRFDVFGTGDDRTCVCWTVEKDVDLPANSRTLDAARKAGLPLLESVPVTIAMAKAEGWFDKKGSKWQTMPELMLRYRAATFFGRMYAPEVLMGLQTEEEAIDIHATTISAESAGTDTVATPEENAPRTRRKTEKGVAAMNAATEPKNVTPAPASPDTQPSAESDTPASPVSDAELVDENKTAAGAQGTPAEPVKSAEPEKPAETAKPAEPAKPSKPATEENGQTTAPTPKRVEIVSSKPTRTPNVHELQLKGDYTGVAYVQTTTVPANGAVLDAVIIDVPSRTNPKNVIKKVESFTVLG